MIIGSHNLLIPGCYIYIPDEVFHDWKLIRIKKKKSRKLCLPIDIQIAMLDTMVKPILMYGCEVWGFANNSVIESFCLQFYKSIFQLGRFSIDIEIKSRMVAFWKRIICNKQDKIAVTLYKLSYKMHLDNLFHSKWIVCIETTLNTCGLSQYWLSQNVPKNVNLSNLVKQSLCDQFKHMYICCYFSHTPDGVLRITKFQEKDKGKKITIRK